MYIERHLMEEVARKAVEVIERPEVKKEISDLIEDAVLKSLPEETRKCATSYMASSYDSPFRVVVQKCTTEWIETNTDAIREATEKAAMKVLTESSVYEEVVKYEFQRYLIKLADEAVKKAMAKQVKKDKKTKKV